VSGVVGCRRIVSRPRGSRQRNGKSWRCRDGSSLRWICSSSSTSEGSCSVGWARGLSRRDGWGRRLRVRILVALGRRCCFHARIRGRVGWGFGWRYMYMHQQWRRRSQQRR
jgi:hypothetical protein